ncbi:MAG: TAT-variant-translocated molybdopterin oxidoreductase, partial [Chitinophagaceae bacterium]
MEKKQYWQSFGEFTDSDAVKQSSQDEFASALPFEELDGSGILDAKTPRRDFLKYLGFSTAAAMAAASCEMPVRHSIPFVNRPQDIIPGEADYYATTYVSGGDVVPVIAKVRDGRPIKLEGNTESMMTSGGTTARVQASVLDLYDMARLRFPMASGKEVSTFDAFDKMVGEALAGAQPVVLLTSTINSPTTKAVIAEFIAKFPGSRHVQYDTVSYSGLLLANELSYGKKELPSYKFDKADVIVSLGADFLGTWLSPIEYQRDYAKGRKIDEKKISMSKHYHLESMMSMTGANADDRYTHKPSETGAVAVALLNALTGQGIQSFSNAKLTAGIKKIAADLIKNKGRGLVVSGSNNPSVQVVVNAINDAIGANGTTIDWSAPLLTRQGIDSDMGALIADINAGKVGSLFVYDVNPVYDYYNAEAFKTAISKVKLTVAFSQKMDETAEYCKFAVPTHHFLESWGDAEPHAGYISMMQPTIMPLFKTRQFEDSLLKWSGNPTTYEAYFKNYWVTKLGTFEAYEGALQKGVIESPAASTAAGMTLNAGAVSAAASAISSMKKGGAKELFLYQNVSMGEGRQANNPWLLELPDPITKATWENYAMVSPALGKELFDIDIAQKRQADVYEIHPEKPQVKVTIGSKTLVLPALIVPGMNNETIAIALGYGRKSKKEEDTGRLIGRASANAGQNVFPLANFNGMTTDFFAGDVTISATDEKVKVAITQSHGSYE